MGASGSMQDQNRYNRMGSASGGALTDLYGKMMSTNQGGRPHNGMMNFGGGVQMYPEEALGRFFSGNSVQITPTQARQMTNRGGPSSYDGAVRSGKPGNTGAPAGGVQYRAAGTSQPPMDRQTRQGK